jgi:hypothetical protein
MREEYITKIMSKETEAQSTPNPWAQYTKTYPEAEYTKTYPGAEYTSTARPSYDVIHSTVDNLRNIREVTDLPNETKPENFTFTSSAHKIQDISKPTDSPHVGVIHSTVDNSPHVGVEKDYSTHIIPNLHTTDVQMFTDVSTDVTDSAGIARLGDVYSDVPSSSMIAPHTTVTEPSTEVTMVTVGKVACRSHSYRCWIL